MKVFVDRHLPGRPFASPKARADTVVMRRSAGAVILSFAVAALALFAAAVGLLSGADAAAVQFTTVRGEIVQLYGQGLYRYDTLFAGAGQRGTDVVIVVLGVPLLIAAAWRYRRGSSRAGLLLLSTLVFFLYVYGSAALGTVAHNRLFPVYVALSSAALFAVSRLVAAVDTSALVTRLNGVPRRATGVFMLLSGAVTLVVWGVPVMAAAVTGDPTAHLDSYSTDVTYALDLGIITPLALLAGVLILRRNATGYLVAMSLLVLEAVLAPLIAAQTVSQVAAGVAFTPAEVAGPVAGFVVIGAAASWFLLRLLRGVGD